MSAWWPRQEQWRERVLEGERERERPGCNRLGVEEDAELESGHAHNSWKAGLKGEERGWYLKEDAGLREDADCR